MFLVNFRDPTEIRIPLTCNHKSRCIQYKYYISVYIYIYDYRCIYNIYMFVRQCGHTTFRCFDML